MAYSLPVELWRVRVVACLPLPDAASLHSTSRALGTSIVNVALLLERIDALLARQLTGVIGVDRTYAPLPHNSLGCVLRPPCCGASFVQPFCASTEAIPDASA
mmetsp:Transcript_8994/g.22078  ORF Transcript_8994/g.22078 Transcript_8994/m.22078 type:complete len:103 (-) Transcript_8994:267-575(-)